METSFYNKRIKGILGILPENSYNFIEEMTAKNLYGKYRLFNSQLKIN